jgi:hypothetical protein
MKNTRIWGALFALLTAAALCASCATKQLLDLHDRDFQTQYDKFMHLIDLTGARTYEVSWGDRLSKIAEEMYGSHDNAYFFPLIMAASSSQVKNPDLIRSGMKLTVPDLGRNLQDTAHRENVKGLLNAIAELYRSSGNKYPATQAGLRAMAAKL